MNIKTVIVKLTSNCNCYCSYCYSKDSIKGSITVDCLEKIIKEILNNGNSKVKFIWHGGEPLLTGINLFEKIIQLQKKYQQKNQVIRNSIHTNGILITHQWLDFFKTNMFHIGISIDGPQFINDNNRLDKNGTSTFKNVINSIELVKKYIFDFGILSVITKQSLKYYNEVFNFFNQIECNNYDLLPCVVFKGGMIDDRNTLTPYEFLNFMKNYFDLWFLNDNPNIKIRHFENILSGLYLKKPLSCTFLGACSEYLAINFNGDVYHCDWFIDDHEKLLGNLLNGSLKYIFSTEKFKKNKNELNSIAKECQECNWLELCNGGCRNYRTLNSNKYLYCETRKGLFNYISRKVGICEQ